MIILGNIFINYIDHCFWDGYLIFWEQIKTNKRYWIILKGVYYLHWNQQKKVTNNPMQLFLTKSTKIK